jgi:hypothetical protein
MGTVIACFPIVGLVDDQFLEYNNMIVKLKASRDPEVNQLLVNQLFAVQLTSHQKKLGPVADILRELGNDRPVSLCTRYRLTIYLIIECTRGVKINTTDCYSNYVCLYVSAVLMADEKLDDFISYLTTLDKRTVCNLCR